MRRLVCVAVAMTALLPVRKRAGSGTKASTEIGERDKSACVLETRLSFPEIISHHVRGGSWSS